MTQGPSELARRLAWAALSFTAPVGGMQRQAVLEAAQAIDRELAKVHAIPAETLDQVQEFMETLIWLADMSNRNEHIVKESRAALSALRAAREGK